LFSVFLFSGWLHRSDASWFFWLRHGIEKWEGG
jgi:hypothetical protein